MHLSEGPIKNTLFMKVWVRIYQQSDVRIEPGVAGWEAGILSRLYAVPIDVLC